MAEPTDLPEIDLDVADVRRIALTTDPQGETMISFEMASGQMMNLVFSPEIFAKLEAMMATANEAQAQVSPIQQERSACADGSAKPTPGARFTPSASLSLSRHRPPEICRPGTISPLR